MSYLILALAALIFVLGIRRTIAIGDILQKVEARRNLVVRVAGFFLMSIWLHLLPSILLTIYMRKEGILAPELVAVDEARAVIVALYILPVIGILVLIMSLGTLDAYVRQRPWSESIAWTLSGFASAIGVLVLIGLSGEIERAFVMFGVSAPLAIYIGLSLLNPIEQHIRLYYLPFVLVWCATNE